MGLINADGDIVAFNVSSLLQSVVDLIAGTNVEIVNGDRHDPAASSLTTEYETVASSLGSSVENLRGFVADKADALTKALQQLQETDQMNADDAAQAAAAIDQLASAAPAPTTSVADSSDQSNARSDFGSGS